MGVGKTGSPAVAGGPREHASVVCVILRLAVLVEHRLVTDRQTDTETQKQGYGIYRAEHS